MVIMVRGYHAAHETFVYTAQKNSLKKTKTFSTYRQFVRGNEKFFYEINNKRVSKSKYLKTLSPLEKSCKKVVSQPYYFL